MQYVVNLKFENKLYDLEDLQIAGLNRFIAFYEFLPIGVDQK